MNLWSIYWLCFSRYSNVHFGRVSHSWKIWNSLLSPGFNEQFDKNGNDPFNLEWTSIDMVTLSLLAILFTWTFPNENIKLSKPAEMQKWSGPERKLDRNQFIFSICINQVKVMETAYKTHNRRLRLVFERKISFAVSFLDYTKNCIVYMSFGYQCLQ